MFYGIIVQMFNFDNQKHNLPHVHVKYSEFSATFSIPDGKIIEGNIPSNKKKLIEAWIEIHKDDLMADWELAINGEQPFKIEPLK